VTPSAQEGSVSEVSQLQSTPDPDLAKEEDAALQPQATPDISIRRHFLPLFAGMGGIDSWLTKATTPESVFERLSHLDKSPLSRSQLCQLLILSHEAGMSESFFRFYWLSAPSHVYEVQTVSTFDPDWLTGDSIVSVDHLRWGLYRFYVDALLFFGNVRSAYRTLRGMGELELLEFFEVRKVQTQRLIDRGPPLPLESIPQDNRHLIAEMACKSLDGGHNADIVQRLTGAYEDHRRRTGATVVSVDELMDGSYVKKNYPDRQEQFHFAADELGQTVVGSVKELQDHLAARQLVFERARNAALANTDLYLSMVEEMDVYVATSMRTREDFRRMASLCDAIFNDHRLHDLNVRYFDPTMSAARGHIDKGLIECLMVKAAKALVYCAGEKESLGKVAEAAMALSQGKPVIFLCENKQQERMYRDIHPLTRLIDFNTGVAVGAMIADSADMVANLLNRILRNKMEYVLEQRAVGNADPDGPGYLFLKERLTDSVVRLQTNDLMLQETFWNYYQSSRPHRA